MPLFRKTSARTLLINTSEISPSSSMISGFKGLSWAVHQSATANSFIISNTFQLVLFNPRLNGNTPDFDGILGPASRHSSQLRRPERGTTPTRLQSYHRSSTFWKATPVFLSSRVPLRSHRWLSTLANSPKNCPHSRIRSLAKGRPLLSTTTRNSERKPKSPTWPTVR